MIVPESPDNNIKEEETELLLPENIQSIFNNELLSQIDSIKWEDRKIALNSILQILQLNSKLSSNDIIDIFDFVKLKLKNFKETNLFLIKDSLPLFCFILNKVDTKNDISNQLVEGFYDKIGEAKLTQDIQKLFHMILDSNQEQFFNLIFKKLKKEKKPSILKEFASFFEDIIKQNGLMKMNKEDIVSFTVMLSNNPNPQIRANAMKVLCLLYPIIGNPLRKKIIDIKDSTKKLIEDAFNRIDGDNMDQYLVNNKSDTSLIESDDLSISKHTKNISQSPILPIKLEANDYQQLLKAIDTGKWSEKKQALERLEADLSQTVSFDQKHFPIDEFFFLIKDKLRDKNQKLVSSILSLLIKTIEILKVNFKTYSDVVALPLINNLNDNKDQVRNSVIICLEKWVQYIGFESILTYLLNALQIEKYDLRLEILKFVNKFRDKIKKAIDTLINPLLICLQDKSNVIRALTEEIIKWTFDNGLNIKHYNDHLTNIKPSIAEKLRSTLDNCCSSNTNDKFGTIDNTNSNLIGFISDREINSSFLNTTYSQNTSSKISSKTVKTDLTPKKARTLTSRAVSPSLSNSNDKIYKTEINFIKMKNNRNAIDKKLKANYDSIKEDQNDNIDNDDDNGVSYLSVFLSDSFIKKAIYSNTAIEIIKVFSNLIQKDSFKEFYYPNYDLSVKYIIKQLENNRDNLKELLQCVDQYLRLFLKQIILNDLQLDYIEAKLTLELLLNIIESKSSLMKKYIDFISIDQSFAIIFEYGINTNSKIKANILELYNDILTNGKIQSIDIRSFKLLIKYLYSAESDIRLKATQLFNTIESILGTNQWKKLLNQLDSNEQNILNNNVQKKQVESNVSNTDNYNKHKSKQKDTTVKVSHQPEQEREQEQQNKIQSSSSSQTQKGQSIIILTNKKKIIELLTQINETESISIKLKNTNNLMYYFTNFSLLSKEQNNILTSSVDVSIQTILYEIESIFDPNDVASPEVQSYLIALLSLFQTIVIHKENVDKMAEDTLINSFIALFNFLQMDRELSIPKSNIALLDIMNNIVLRIIENSDITLVIIVLLDIAEKCKEENMTGVLAVNCLLHLNEHIGAMINQINIGVVLNKMNEILDNYDKEELNEGLVVKIIKKLLFELIKHRKHEIVDDYDNSISDNAIPDKYIFDWIDKCLEQLTKPPNNKNKGNNKQISNEGNRTNIKVTSEKRVTKRSQRD